MTENKDNDSPPPEIVDAGADIAGAATGATLGTFLGGPAGAVIGAAMGHTLRKIGAEINNRYISPREDERVASALTYAIERAERKIEDGEEIRSDGFFDEGTDDRSTADEIVEGALIAAQREHEERKVEYIGYLIANICFDESVGGSQSNALISTAERMSWRQIRILAYLLRPQEFSGLDRTTPTFSPDSIRDLEPPPDNFLHEFSELQQMRLLMDLEAFMSFPFDPDRYVVSKFGKKLYSLMELEKIDPSVLREFSKLCKFGRYDV